jgi:hypothetical protein
MKVVTPLLLTAALLTGCGISDHPLPPDDGPSSFRGAPPIAPELARDDRSPAKKAVDDLVGLTLVFRSVNHRWPEDQAELIAFAASRQPPVSLRSFTSLAFTKNDDDTATITYNQPGRLFGPGKVTVKYE